LIGRHLKPTRPDRAAPATLAEVGAPSHCCRCFLRAAVVVVTRNGGSPLSRSSRISLTGIVPLREITDARAEDQPTLAALGVELIVEGKHQAIVRPAAVASSLVSL
jgi:hypothetical protein